MLRSSRGSHVVLGTATLLLTAATVVAGRVTPAAAALAPLFVLVVLAAAALLGGRAAAVHAVTVVLAGGGALAVAGPPGWPLLWAAVAIAVVAVAFVTGRLEDRVIELTATDPLTGVVNQHFFQLALEHECARADRTTHPLCLAMLCFEGFRDYAFERGQAAAEQLLAEAGAAWRPVLRAGDVLGRMRADEFALLLPECGSSAAALVLARLRAAAPAGKSLLVGLATWEPGETPYRLTQQAGEALDVARRGAHAPGYSSAG
jgi:diguanylate cyclase (GGDEF)-like protein